MAVRRSCIEVAVGLLARREHSELELQRKLEKRDFDSYEIETCIEKLLKSDLLSNERFTESYTRQRVSRGYGGVKIGYELRERGISDGMAREALSEYAAQWLDIALTTHKKRFGKVATDYAERAKQARFLRYKGFTSEQVSAVLK